MTVFIQVCGPKGVALQRYIQGIPEECFRPDAQGGVKIEDVIAAMAQAVYLPEAVNQC